MGMQATVAGRSSPVRPENIYQETKLEAEALVQTPEYDFETSIVRIAETYGPGDQRLLKLFRALERGHFFMIGRGTNRRQCIHVNDLVRGLLLRPNIPRRSARLSFSPAAKS